MYGLPYNVRVVPMIPVGTGCVLDVCLCLGYGGVGGVCGEWVGGLNHGMEGCGCVMSV